MTEQLKLCLRCGGKPTIEDDDGYIYCADCGHWSGDMTMEEAIAWWNERPATDKLLARITALEAQLEAANKRIDWQELKLAVLQDKCTRLERQLKRYQGEL